jgi:hypothetical protein
MIDTKTSEFRTCWHSSGIPGIFLA